jgi:phosphatidylglycerophosphate synthase
MMEEETTEEDIKKINKMIYNKSILTGKIHGSLEDPFSQILYDISDLISPSLRSADITPNFITTVRFLMMLGMFPYFFCNKMYNMAAIVYMVSYFFDCLDGHMSRKYNLDTDFGDYYDHIADALSFILAMYFIAVTLSDDNKWIIVLIIFTGIMGMVQVSCQERYLKHVGSEKDSYTLNLFSNLCPASVIHDDDIEKTMDITKLFGMGTFQILITLLIWNFKHLE